MKSFQNKKDKSLNFLHGEGVTSSVENAGISYQSASLLSAGGTIKEVAVLSGVTNLIFAVLLIRVTSLIKFGDALKRVIVTLSIISALGWVPLILAPLVFTGVSPSLLIILWVISLVPDLMIGPLRDKWLSDLIPSGKLGRYLSLRTIISAGTYLGSFFVMGYMLDHWKGGIFNGYTFIFLFAFLGSLVSVIMYLIIKAPVPVGEAEPADIGLFGFVSEVKQNELGTFMVFTTLVIFSAGICGTFFSVYMLTELHFTYLTFALVVSAEFAARICSSRFWGKLIDTRGAIKVLRVSAFMIPALPVLWLFSSNVGYLIGVQVLSGIAWGAFDLCTQAYLFRASPPNKRLYYIVYQRGIVTLAAAGGPLLGAGLLNLIYPVFGSQILGIFLLSGILRFLVIIAIVPHLKSTDTGEREVGPSTAVNGLEIRPAKIKAEPYHRRTGKYSTAISTWQPVQPGLLYHRELWPQPHRNQGNREFRPFIKELTPSASRSFAMLQDDRNKCESPIKIKYENTIYHRKTVPLSYPLGKEGVDKDFHKSNIRVPAFDSTKDSPEVRRLKDTLPRDIEYHKRWASGVSSPVLSIK